MTGFRRALFALCFAAACAPGEHKVQASSPAEDASGVLAADPTTATPAAGQSGMDSTVVASDRAAAHGDSSTTATPMPTSQYEASTPLASAPVRALYVNRWASQSTRRMAKLIAAADSTEINAFVIDMKDEFGLNYKSQNPTFAKNAGSASVIRNVQRLLDTLHAHNILPIARMVVFKDSVTARIHPEWTIRRTDGSIWRDKKGIAWVNPYHHELWQYNIGVAEELAKMGFKELQFDYIRFPEPYPSLPQQVFPDANGVSKADVLAAYLVEAKTRLNKVGVRSTADIFGLVTTVGGPLEVGQYWEKISPHVDVVLPMVYPSHYARGELGIAHPNAEPYEVIVKSLRRARERDEKLGISTSGHIRPWLQAFTLGKPAYGPEQLEAEKKAVYDAGYDGWVLWNPGSIYDVFMPALEKTFVSHKKVN